MKAYQLLEELRGGNTDPAVRAEFNKTKQDFGLRHAERYTPNVTDATEAQIQLATKDSIPRACRCTPSASWWPVA